MPSDNDNNNTSENEPPQTSDHVYTGAELRAARRKAQMLGLNPSNGREAAQMLADRGIEIGNAEEQRNAIARVEPTKIAASNAGTSVSKSAAHASSSTQTDPMPVHITSEERQREIEKIQQEIKARRRKNLFKMIARLVVFVILPTFAMYYYFSSYITQRYTATTDFRIEKSDPAPGIGGLLSGTPFAKDEDSIGLQRYLDSIEGMRELTDHTDFIADYSGENVDPLHRLSDTPTESEVYSAYKDAVKVAFDPSEGLIRLTVKGYSAEDALDYAENLLIISEEHIDEQTLRMRTDQVRAAEENLEEARNNLDEARTEVLRLQREVGLIDPTSATQTQLGIVSSLETELQQKEINLATQLSNPDPNAARVNGLRTEIDQLRTQISEINSQISGAANGGNDETLAALNDEYAFARAEVESRTTAYNSNLAAVQAAREQASNQIRYLTTSLSPSVTNQPDSPDVFVSTITSLIVFFFLYLFVSMTIAVLKEQLN